MIAAIVTKDCRNQWFSLRNRNRQLVRARIIRALREKCASNSNRRMTRPKPSLPESEAEPTQSFADMTVTIEFMVAASGLFGGPDEALGRVRDLPVQAWALEPGASLKPGDAALRLRGAYRVLGPRLNAIAGILACTSGWTTAARELAEAAKPAPAIFRGASNVHPDLYPQLERAAVTGGCLGADAVWNRGLLARDVVLLTGDTVRALRAFDERLPPDVPRLTRGDLFHDEADEAVRAALALGNSLGGIVIPVETPNVADALARVTRVRAQLELAGFPRVEIFLDGRIPMELLHTVKSERIRIDGYFVGEQIGAAVPLAFSIELRESNDKPLGRRGQVPGITPSLRLKQMLP